MAEKKKNTVSRKTNIHSIFSTDKSKEEDGAWVEVNGFYGLKIKVRRMRSDTVMKAYEKIVRETLGDGKLRKPSDIGEEESLMIIKRQLSEAVLIDWVNLRDAETGEEIPFSTETAMELMEVTDFREFVYQASQERDTFREDFDEESEGN